jgi:cobalt-zinc-cadmium efflux system outer membrane protein
MYARRAGLLILVGMLALWGCAVRRYQAAPIVPSETASRLQERTLDDPGLRDFLQRNLGQRLTAWPLQTWNLGTLTLAALYFNPAMDSARARVAAAQAAIITAGAKPNPVLDFAAGVPSPYLLTLDLVVPIETAGKRGYRVQSARSLGQAAQFDLADTVWNVRSRVRAALLDYLLTSRTLDQLRAEEQIRTQQVDLLQQRFAVGEIASPDLNLVRIELSKVHLTISNSEGQLQRAKAALAASIGIPGAALQNTHFAWPGLEFLPAVESFSPQEIQRAAVLNRLDVRRALAQYAAAEANLQLEIARQYPDVSVGPGYTYEERNSFFEPAVSITLPLFNRNQGPIAEAEAARREAASTFIERQAQVIAESQQALALYKAAVKEFTEANETLQRLQGEQEQIVRSAVSVGEEDRLTLNGIQLESLVASRARLDALNHALTTLGQLEDAVQRPLAGDGFPMSPDSPALTNVPEESKR